MTSMFRGGAVVLLCLSAAFAQQEVDPTWHDPWQTVTKPAAQEDRAKISEERNGLKKGSTAALAQTQEQAKKKYSADTHAANSRELATKRAANTGATLVARPVD